MKIPWWAIVVGALVLLAGAYLLGRIDAPDADDSVTQSLLDGVNAYAAAHNRLTAELNAAHDSIEAGVKRERALAATRTPTPAIVPAVCKVWADNLVTCDKQVTALKDAIAHAGRLKGIAIRQGKADSARADSATKALDREVDKSKILGIQLPSRKTSYAAGTVAGAVKVVLVCIFTKVC